MKSNLPPNKLKWELDAGMASKDGMLHQSLGKLSKMPMVQVLACSKTSHSMLSKTHSITLNILKPMQMQMLKI